MTDMVQTEAQPLVQAGFDYEQLAPEVRTDVQESTRRIHELERRTSESIVEIGRELQRVKEKLPHGEFLPWLDAEFGWGRITAHNFMKVAETFSNVQSLNIYQPSALYALASNNVPDEMREDFRQVADAGQKVTHSAVQNAIVDHRDRERRTTLVVDEGTGEILGDVPWEAERPPGSPPVPHVSRNSGENEWYTPVQYIAAARQVMGSIDLDPASSDVANRTVQAARCYTKENNGLAQEWAGRVWMNPPYATPLITHFCEKMVTEFGAGRVAEAIVLVNNATETRWFQGMARRAAAVCFPASRVRFLDPEGNTGQPLQGQAILYFGPNDDAFQDAFAGFGVVL